VRVNEWERYATWSVVGLVAALGLIGAVNSFTHVAEAVRPSFGELAPTVPLGIDIGIAAFTGLDLLMARMGMRTRWLRLVPWALVGVTVYLNVAGEVTLVGQLAHGVLPLLWVVAVEAGAHVVRTLAGLSGRGAPRMDRIRPSRWLLAPLPTLLLWRRMVLWELRSYTQALDREQDRLLARSDLQDAHGGVAYRWKAPRRDRVMYRLGRRAPAQPEPAPALAPVAVASSAPPVAQPGPASSNGNGHKLSVDDAARLIHEQAQAAGRDLSARELVRRLQDEGHACGRARAGQLLRGFAREVAS